MAQIIRKVGDFNVQVADLQRRGFRPRIHRHKRDIDNFFGNVPRNLVVDAWNWAHDKYLSIVGSRR
eukprot:6839216-Karenia_brevis.AAC.1